MNVVLLSNEDINNVPDNLRAILADPDARRNIQQEVQRCCSATVTQIEADYSCAAPILAANPDLVVNFASGYRGPSREVFVPCLLECLGIRCTGSDALTTSICQDKASTNNLLLVNKIPVPRQMVVDGLHVFLEKRPWIWPAIVKPMHGTAAVGIMEYNIVDTEPDLEALSHELLEDFPHGLVVEEYIHGREFSLIAVGHPLGSGGVEIQCFGCELLLDQIKDARIYGTEIRTAGMPVPTQLPPRGKDWTNIQAVVGDTYRALGCRDWAQIDVRLGVDHVPYVIDVNPVLQPQSLVLQRFPEAIGVMLEAADGRIH